MQAIDVTAPDVITRTRGAHVTATADDNLGLKDVVFKLNGTVLATQTKAPFLRIYHDTIDAYRSFQQQQATQLGISITDLRRFTSQYGALFNDQRASAQFLRQHLF